MVDVTEQLEINHRALAAPVAKKPPEYIADEMVDARVNPPIFVTPFRN